VTAVGTDAGNAPSAGHKSGQVAEKRKKKMLTVTYNRRDLEVKDSRSNRSAHILPAIFKCLGGYAEALANEAMQNPLIPVMVPNRVRANWRRIW
jgi:hypothetical protein